MYILIVMGLLVAWVLVIFMIRDEDNGYRNEDVD